MYRVCDINVSITQKQADEKAALLKAQLEKRRKRREEGPVISNSPKIPSVVPSKSPEIPAKSPEIPFKSSDNPPNPAKAGHSAVAVAAAKPHPDNRPIRPSKVANKFSSCVTAGEAIIDPEQPPQLPREEVLPTESGEVVKPIPAFVVKEDKKSGTFVKDKNPKDMIFIGNDVLNKPDSDGSVSGFLLRSLHNLCVAIALTIPVMHHLSIHILHNSLAFQNRLYRAAFCSYVFAESCHTGQ